MKAFHFIVLTKSSDLAHIFIPSDLWYSDITDFGAAFKGLEIAEHGAGGGTSSDEGIEHATADEVDSMEIEIGDEVDSMDDQEWFSTAMVAGLKHTRAVFKGQNLIGGVHHLNDAKSTALLHCLFTAGLLKRGSRVMDVGCGYPLIIIKALAFTGAPVIATDIRQTLDQLNTIFDGDGATETVPFFASVSPGALPGEVYVHCFSSL